ncbi:MAG: hypothetical protein V3U24_09260 [Candidatus Neomarinimicrobiota bacterium]
MSGVIIKNSLCLVFLAGSILQAQENKLFWDGQDWDRLSRRTAGYPEYTYLAKAAYVNGLMDGRLYDFFKTWAADSSLADSVIGRETVDYLTTSELVRVLDNFYSDPLNRYIPISSAIIIVNLYAAGEPSEMIDGYTHKTKEWINDLMLRMEGIDYYQLMREKQKKQFEGKEE